MKQHIKVEQYENLNEQQQIKLSKLIGWSHGNSLCFASKFVELITTGKMIEILTNTCSNMNIAPDWYDKDNGWEVKVDIATGKNEGKLKVTSEKELCDALWKTIVEVI